MVFQTESEMYPFIERWLKTREEKSCSDATSEFYYDYADRTRFADVMGVYRIQGSPRFVGVEAKLYKNDLGKAVRQARRLQSFCHEVYVAIPKEQFNLMSENEREDYLNLLYSNQIGFIVVKQRGLPDVVLETRPSMFDTNRYDTAKEYFTDQSEDLEKGFTSEVLSDEMCEILLNDFEHTNVFKEYEFLNVDWWYNYDVGSSWIGSVYGYITVETHRIVFDIIVQNPEALFTKLLKSPAESAKTITQGLRKFNGPIDWSMRGFVKSPQLVTYYARRNLWTPPNSNRFLRITMDFGYLVNEINVYSAVELLNTRAAHRVFIQGELSRNVLVQEGGISSRRHYAEDLRDFFDILFQISKTLCKD